MFLKKKFKGNDPLLKPSKKNTYSSSATMDYNLLNEHRDDTF